MNTTIVAALKQLFIALAGISIVGATVATGTVGATNLVSKFTQKEQKIAQVEMTEQKKPDATEKIEIIETGKPAGPTVIPVKKVITSGTGITLTPSPTASVKTNSGCIVSLFGKQYDVTTLQQTHSGGNIFNCGTDMTAVYQEKHGTNMSRMQQYLVTSGSTGTTTTGAGAQTNTQANTTLTRRSESEDTEEEEERKHEMEKVLESAKKELEHEDD